MGQVKLNHSDNKIAWVDQNKVIDSSSKIII